MSLEEKMALHLASIIIIIIIIIIIAAAAAALLLLLLQVGPNTSSMSYKF